MSEASGEAAVDVTRCTDALCLAGTPHSSSSQLVEMRLAPGDKAAPVATPQDLLDVEFPTAPLSTVETTAACHRNSSGTSDCLWCASREPAPLPHARAHIHPGRIDGTYDPYGRQDYVAETVWLEFGNGSSSATHTLVVTNDSALEAPDEVLQLRLSVPGMVPSPEGKLWGELTIEDDGDGAWCRAASGVCTVR